MECAIVFPGQGSQAVGMLAALAAAHPEPAACFAEASAVLGYDLGALVREGPAEELNRTERTQPALLAADIACYRIWRRLGGPVPTVMAGHSLGEYAALVAAGALGFADGIRLVALRGRLMQEAVPAGQGAMAAILGLDAATVAEICRAAAQEEGAVVECANLNAPAQIVIAGTQAAVARAAELAKARGAKRVLPLAVSVPSHCALMRGAAERLAEALAGVELRTPSVPVLHNVDALAHPAPAECAQALAAQLHQPVRWVDLLGAVAARGVTAVLECGPGKVLIGLNKQCAPGLRGLAIGDPQGLAEALALVGATT
jgi:[acyl-carrier-protein] S-malonyltransferase